MDLLEHLEERGYPVEYLLSRIRGRRARLIRDWQSLLFDRSSIEAAAASRGGLPGAVTSPDAAWRLLGREYRWVYGQMNRDLRVLFRYFFLYAELRPLCICLRRLQAKQPPGDDVLAASLLAPDVKAALRGSDTLSGALAGIEPFFLSLSERFGGLPEVAEQDGIRAVEQQIVLRFLEHAMTAPLAPLIRSFFAMVIDARNIMGLSKYLTLGMHAPPKLIPGGSVDLRRLGAVAANNDLDGLSALLREIAGRDVPVSGGPSVEIALYRSMTRRIRSSGRDPLGAGVILDYLWRCSIEAMNLSLLLQGKDLEAQHLTEELVQ